LPTVRHRFNIYASSCVVWALWRGDGHRQLVTRFGRFGVIWRVMKGLFFGLGLKINRVHSNLLNISTFSANLKSTWIKDVGWYRLLYADALYWCNCFLITFPKSKQLNNYTFLMMASKHVNSRLTAVF